LETIFIEPSESSRLLVRRFEVLKSSGIQEEVRDSYIPDGNTAIVFHLSGNVFLDGPEPRKLPSFFITCPRMTPLEIDASGDNLDSVIVICHSTILSRLLGLDFTGIKGSPFLLPDSKIFQPLWEDLNSHIDTGNRVLVLDHFLSARLESISYEKDDIDKIYDQIMEFSGISTINKLLSSCAIRPRTFRRKFLQRSGLSAKSLARISRVNYLWDKILQGEDINYQDMAFEGDYFDQAHFINDFKMIVGETPSQFFKRNLTHIKLLSGKK
jgi:AraC-like DNA-binding protein